MASAHCLRADARLTVLRGVARILAIEERDIDYGQTDPDIVHARDAIRKSWDPIERRSRWLVAHTLGNISDCAETYGEMRREFRDRKGRTMAPAAYVR
jgi:hypothetical protein